MNSSNDRVPIECWWETATTTLNLDSDALLELGAARPRSSATGSAIAKEPSAMPPIRKEPHGA